MATARAGFFFSSMTASPPSTFFSCAFIAVAVANMAVADKKARRVSLIDVEETSSSIGRLDRNVCLSMCIGNGTLSAFIDTIHTGHTSTIVYFMGLGIDARSFTVAGAKSATVALRGIYNWFEKRIFR